METYVSEINLSRVQRLWQTGHRNGSLFWSESRFAGNFLIACVSALIGDAEDGRGSEA